ncbi:aldehyde reductase [Lewinella sp. W8]|uniref:SDR family oxidoreductase n=1 Tax=Lewinella sp. W8 TaxID=2528208 RepID=UPI00106783F8|nr:aldehyde reductase [Lewinella sp. W8]MTB50526.1 NAD-dependent epimerase/dehydratase family protein [Lewinella sp. W8]
MTPITSSPILLTGLTGYIGSQIAVQLLQRGYRVRGTARNPAKAEAVKTAIGQRVATEGLEIVRAELMDADSWRPAMTGVEYVLHVASPLAAVEPKDPNELIVPAREGTLNVLRAATEAGVKRVVITSSMAAVVYGQDNDPANPMTEKNWTNPERKDDVTAYILSKYYAERAAWQHVDETPGAPELVTVNPGAVLGPLIGNNPSDSLLIVQKMMRGDLPGVPKFGFEIVDVRDVADLHLRAMESPAAAGERFLAVAGHRTFLQIAETLRNSVPAQAKKVPRMQFPNFLIRLSALFDPETRGILNELGRKRVASSAKAREVLGWTPRTPEEAIRATAESLIERELV